MTTIWLPDYEHAPSEGIESLMEEYMRSVDRVAPPGLIFRKDPHAPSRGPIDTDSIPAQAVFSTLLEGVAIDFGYPNVYTFLNPPGIESTKTPFRERLLVTARLYEQYKDNAKPAMYWDYGTVFDPCSDGMINYASTEKFWIRREVIGYEVLFDTEKPETRFLCNAIFGENMYNYFMEQHSKRNLFEHGPLEFVVAVALGWKLPIIGVTEVICVEQHKRKKYILNKDGIREEPVTELELHRDRYLHPRDGTMK